MILELSRKLREIRQSADEWFLHGISHKCASACAGACVRVPTTLPLCKVIIPHHRGEEVQDYETAADDKSRSLVRLLLSNHKDGKNR